jgi:GNAT superfamily N-acetyltransferase
MDPAHISGLSGFFKEHSEPAAAPAPVFKVFEGQPAEVLRGRLRIQPPFHFTAMEAYADGSAYIRAATGKPPLAEGYAPVLNFTVMEYRLLTLLHAAARYADWAGAYGDVDVLAVLTGPTAMVPSTGPGAGPVPLDEVTAPVRATFSAFAEKMAGEGFAFLDARIREHGTGPVLTCQRDGTIAGAIGPMEIMPDSLGSARLLSQYFGVLPEHRGLGLGRSLWRAAMRWGQQHHAAYQLLQTETGGASDRLCQSEGLTDLGLVCTSIL